VGKRGREGVREGEREKGKELVPLVDMFELSIFEMEMLLAKKIRLYPLHLAPPPHCHFKRCTGSSNIHAAHLEGKRTNVYIYM